MNKNKITSIVLISAMLLESLPVVNAYDVVDSDNINVASESTNLQYTEDIEENLDDDILDDSEAIDNNSESIENPKDSKLEDLDLEDLNSDANNNDINNYVSIIPSLENDDVNSEAIIEDLESNENININRDAELNKEIISESIEALDIDDSVSSVLEITLTDGEFVPDLTNNPNGYKTIVVKTTGNKKLVSTDYDRLRTSLIPNIDLSGAQSDSIPAGAFANATHLTTFKFPQGIKSIDDASTRYNGAFYNCKNLKGDLIIPDSVTFIGNYAFYGCSGFTGNLVIPNSVVTIGNYAFSACSGFTGDLVIPKSVTSISKEAFSFCRGFTGDLVIPNSVTSIEAYAFYGCSGFTGNLVIPDSVTTIGDYAFTNCSGFTGDLIIPNSIASIPTSAFQNCSSFNGNLVIPDSVITISNYAFYNCKNLKGNLIIPDSVAAIGQNAFYGCSSFTGNLIIPDSVESIGINALYNCSNIDNIIFRTNESFVDSNYRKDIFDKLDINNTIIEMSYNFDTSGTWLDTLDAKNIGKPILKSEIQTDDGSGSLSTSLYIPTPYKDENITILKDGEAYDLPTKTSDAKYLFDEEGSYNITLTTDLGSVSNIDFEVAASINKPTIEYKNNLVCIVDNGNNLGLTTDRIEYRINGGEWRVYSGSFRVPDELVNGIDNIKVEARVVVGAEVSKVTEYSLTIPKAQITVSDVEITEGDKFNEYDIISAIDIDGTDISDRVTVVSSDIKLDTPGEYTIVYRVEASNGYFTEKEIKVTVLKKKLPPIIIAEDITLEKGEEFNPLDFITVTDSDGKDIDKSNIEIIENTVNIWEPGDYKISFRIVDDNGLEATETIVVTIKEPTVDDENNTDGDGNQNNNTSTNNSNINNTNNTINKDTITSTGGVAPLLHLTSIISFIGGYYFINKRNKR